MSGGGGSLALVSVAVTRHAATEAWEQGIPRPSVSEKRHSGPKSRCELARAEKRASKLPVAFSLGRSLRFSALKAPPKIESERNPLIVIFVGKIKIPV